MRLADDSMEDSTMFKLISRRYALAILGPIANAAIFIISTVCLTSSAFAASQQAPRAPAVVVQQTINKALVLLKNDSIPKRQRRRELITLVQGNFDFSAMARSALGRHWKTLSSDDRRQFVAVFIAFLEDAYIGKIESYTGQPIQFANETVLSDDQVEIQTNILQSEGEPVKVNYLMQREADDWKVYDVTVDSISIIANYRNQFDRVINQHGFPALINSMREKQKHLEATT
jgi:phospholipid transport system substrate-binding protein